VTKLPVVSGREVVRALERAGFAQVGAKGSHCKLFHDERRLTVIVPCIGARSHEGRSAPSSGRRA
jgi:predicted RNA binding protein YcfA (HicA-like mRNA interferase family)